MRSRLFIISLLSLTLVVSSLYQTPVVATAPEGIVLTYDPSSQTLGVNVSHYVANTKTHYIDEIQIANNEVSVLNRTYANQSHNYGIYDSFTVSATTGDNLTVTAHCKKGYSLSQWVIVATTNSTSSTSTSTTTPPPPDGGEDSGGSLGVGLAIGVGGVLIISLGILYALRDSLPESVQQLGSRIRMTLFEIGGRLKAGLINLGQWMQSKLQK